MDACEPQNDLDCYYNSNWKRHHKIPNNKLSISTFSECQDQIDAQLLRYANHNNNPDLTRFVRSFHNRNNSSLSLISLVNDINSIQSISDLARITRSMILLNIPTLFSVSIAVHYTLPRIYCINISEPPILSSYVEAYNSDDTDVIVQMYLILAKMHRFIEDNWIHLDPIKEFIYDCLMIETLLSKDMLTALQQNDPSQIYHSLPSHQFYDTYDNSFWRESLQGITGSIISYNNPKQLSFINKLLDSCTSLRLRSIKNYLIYSVISKYGIYTDASKIIDLTTLIKLDTKKLLLDTVCENFGYDLQDYYESIHANSIKTNQVRQMFIRIKQTAINLFSEKAFFTQSTQQELLSKLNKLDIVIGTQPFRTYPSSMTDDFFLNLFKNSSSSFLQKIQLINKPVNRTWLSVEDDVYSFMINAYYDPTANLVYLPTAMMSDSFFRKIDSLETLANNYGSLGTVISHEIVHSFDTYGRMFDADGLLRNWWSKEDYERYQKEIDKVIAHYDRISVFGSQIDGKVTVSENMADILGLKLSLTTLIRSVPNIPNHILERFFQGWVETMRDNSAPELIKQTAEQDVHSPSTVRINAPFSHINEYYQLFNVTPSHFNYLDPSLRITLLDTDTRI